MLSFTVEIFPQTVVSVEINVNVSGIGAVKSDPPAVYIWHTISSKLVVKPTQQYYSSIFTILITYKHCAGKTLLYHI